MREFAIATAALIAAAGGLAGCSYPDEQLASSRQPSPSTAVASPAVAAAMPARKPASPAHKAGAPGPQLASAQPFGADELPLVVIRLEQPDIDYEQPLYDAVSEALKRKPSATFLVQAAVPGSDSLADATNNAAASRQDVQKVFHSLRDMGLPADRISLSVATLPEVESSEIRVYVH